MIEETFSFLDDMEYVDPAARYSDAVLEAAVALRRVGELKEALKLANKAIKRKKSNPKAYIIAGMILEDLGELEKAEESLEKAVLADIDNDEALKTLGLFHVKHDKPIQGILNLCDYVDRENWEEINLIQIIDTTVGAVLSNFNRNPEEAKSILKAVETLRGAWEKTLNHKIGEIYGRRARFIDKEASVKVLGLIAKQTDYHHYWNQLGISLYWHGQYKEAAEAYENAIRSLKEMDYQDFYEDDEYTQPIDIDYEDREYSLGIYYTNLASSLLKANQAEKALEAAQTAIEEYEYVDLFSWEIKIEALTRLDRYDQIIEEAPKIILRYPNEPNIAKIYHWYLGSLEAQNRMGEYQQVYEEAITNFPEDFEFNRDLGQYYLEMERYQEAADTFAKIEEKNISKSIKVIFAFDRYMLLHRIGHPERAWETIKPYTENVDWFFEDEPSLRGDPKFNNAYIRFWGLTTSTAFSEYQQNQEYLLKDIFQQFLQYYPEDVNFLAAYAHVLIQAKLLDQAKEQLQAGLNAPDQSLKPLFLNNLGYIALLENRFQEAKNIFSNIDPTTKVIRPIIGGNYVQYLVAFWKDGEIIQDPSIQPYNEVDLITAWEANHFVLAMQEGDISLASYYALNLIVNQPEPQENQNILTESDKSLGFIVGGCLALARKEWASAMMLWEKSLQMAKDMYVDKYALDNSYLARWLKEVKEKTGEVC